MLNQLWSVAILIDLTFFKSSAYSRHSDDRQNLTSLMQKMKRRGPKALPWGRPEVAKQESENIPLIFTL